MKIKSNIMLSKATLQQGTALSRRERDREKERSLTVKATHGRSSLESLGQAEFRVQQQEAAVRPTSGAETIMAAINEP